MICYLPAVCFELQIWKLCCLGEGCTKLNEGQPLADRCVGLLVGDHAESYFKKIAHKFPGIFCSLLTQRFLILLPWRRFRVARSLSKKMHAPRCPLEIRRHILLVVDGSGILASSNRLPKCASSE
eukprot:gnl/TRDRNA2_/TRDRNA2_125951_c0_seq1.p1 gnl/TRDRNA2_/TRDRNA2_125951_c0~~gnl/TRDRNA2_/TRDRNA2_125951_c0_seq1.p1  ORF type:complete len:125 (-),score=7.37 gnl/TRDRNA2_/TRDRNA2_125951_c0_seq1:119-493(-)